MHPRVIFTKLTYRFSLFKNVKHLSLRIASILIALFLLSYLAYASFDVTNNTDSSWQYALSGLRHSAQNLGVDLYYTYGPLYEIMPTYLHAQDTFGNFLVGNIIFLYLIVVFSIIFYTIIRFLLSKRTGLRIDPRTLLLSTGAVLALTITDIDTVFNILLLATLVAARLHHSYIGKLFLISGIYALSLYKFNYLVPTLALTPLIFLTGFKLRELGHILIRCLGPLSIFAVGFFIFTGEASFSNLLKFMYYATTNTLAYSEFMGLSYKSFTGTIIAYLTIFGLAVCSFLIFFGRHLANHTKRHKPVDLDITIFGFAFLLVAFLDLKHAIVRNDIHLLSFTPFIFLCLLFSYIYITGTSFDWIRKFKYVNLIVVVCISLLGILSHIVVVKTVFDTDTVGSLSITKSYFVSSFSHATINNRLNLMNYYHYVHESRAKINQRSNEITGILNQIKKLDTTRPIIFYGNTNLYGEIMKDNKLDITYTPYLQNYVAHPPSTADKLYINQLKANPNAYIFIEEREPSIDQRVPAHELNDFFQYVAHNYKVVAADITKLQYVFERKSQKSAYCKQVSRFSFSEDSLAAIPTAPSIKRNQYIQFKLEKKLNLPEKVVSMLVKNPVYSLTLITPDNLTMKVRTTRSTLEHGITISPFNQTFRDLVTGKPFIMKTFILHNEFPGIETHNGIIEVCSYL